MSIDNTDIGLTSYGPALNASLHEFFVRAGRMVAFPLGYPGASAAIEADESHVQALDTSPDGTVYGGTGGWMAHVFAGFFTGVTGAVVDLGTVAGMSETVAVGCGTRQVAAWLAGPNGSRLVSRPLEPQPYDLTQEGGFRPGPFTDLGDPVPGERPVAAVRTPCRRWLVGATANHLFRLDLVSLEITTVTGVGTTGPLGVTRDGVVLGVGDGNTLWRYDPAGERLDPGAVALPDGDWTAGKWRWARGALGEAQYLADAAGRLLTVDGEGNARAVGQAPRRPVTAMAVSPDGRLFGFCGNQIETLFCFDPAAEAVSDLGAAVSVLQTRRHGWAFSSAVVGPDGEIIFAEDDDLGHLWFYFPRILPR